MGRAAKVPYHLLDVQDPLAASLLGSPAFDEPARLAGLPRRPQAGGLRPEEAARTTLPRCGSQRGLLLVAHLARKGTARRIGTATGLLAGLRHAAGDRHEWLLVLARTKARHGREQAGRIGMVRGGE